MTTEQTYFIHDLTEEEYNDLNYDYEFNKERNWNWGDSSHKPPFDTDYSEMDVDEDDEVLRMVIGKKGCYLCRITEGNNIASITHDRKRKKFVIWGEHHKMKHVKNELECRIKIVKEELAIR